MSKQLINWIISGLMFVAEMSAVTANETPNFIIAQPVKKSENASSPRKEEITPQTEQQVLSEQAPLQSVEPIKSLDEQPDDQSELSDETKEADNAPTKKTRFGIGYEYRTNHGPERIDRPERPERPQRAERPQRPDRPGRFGW